MKKIEHDVRVAAEIGYDVRWAHPFVKAIADRFDEIRAHRRAMAEAADRKIGALSAELAEARRVRADDDDFAANLLAANERMGEALVAIGMALGLDPPRTGKTWGAPEILARIAELNAQAERVRGEVRRLRPIEARARDVVAGHGYDPDDRNVARHILGGAGDG